MNGTDASPSVHWGSGADSHLPAVSGATALMTLGTQDAAAQERTLPSLISAFHSGVTRASTLTRSRSTRSCQKSAVASDSSLSMPTFQVSPSLVHHSAPACAAWAAKNWNSPGSKLEM